MKLRIRDNIIRLRLSQSETDKLDESGEVASEVEFPGGSHFRYAVVRGGEGAITCSFNETGLKVSIPEGQISTWAATDQVGLQNSISLENGSELNILVEKDFQCLTARSGEDETDMFPNPMTSQSGD